MTHWQLLSWFISSYCPYHTRNQSQWQEYIILSDTTPISVSRLLACHVSRGVQCDMLTTIRECPGLSCHEGHLSMGGLLAYTILPFYSSPVTQNGVPHSIDWVCVPFGCILTSIIHYCGDPGPHVEKPNDGHFRCHLMNTELKTQASTSDASIKSINLQWLCVHSLVRVKIA